MTILIHFWSEGDTKRSTLNVNRMSGREYVMRWPAAVSTTRALFQSLAAPTGAAVERFEQGMIDWVGGWMSEIKWVNEWLFEWLSGWLGRWLVEWVSG